MGLAKCVAACLAVHLLPLGLTLEPPGCPAPPLPAQTHRLGKRQTGETRASLTPPWALAASSSEGTAPQPFLAGRRIDGGPEREPHFWVGISGGPEHGLGPNATETSVCLLLRWWWELRVGKGERGPSSDQAGSSPAPRPSQH